MKLIYTILVLTVHCVLSKSISKSLDKQWNMFKLKYNKNYESVEEETVKKAIFQNNLEVINKHNNRFKKGIVTFRLGINDMADMTMEEVIQKRTGLRIDNSEVAEYEVNLNITVPDTIDWREKEAVTSVKSHDQYGSYVFSATGAIEGQIAIKHNIHISLSIQQIVDCIGYDKGCTYMALRYVKECGGIESEAKYPNEAKVGKCRFNKSDVVAKVTGYNKIKQGNENHLKEVVANVGPVAVAVDASHFQFRSYKGGVLYIPDCSSYHVNHFLLVVGYGNENSQDYWLLKNSWGADWGDKGYIKIARNKKNNCGVASYGVIPTIA